MPGQQHEPPVDRLLRLIFVTVSSVSAVALLLFVALLFVLAAVGGD